MIAKSPIASGQGPKWRSTTTIDLGAIEKIANVVHADLSESREVFAEKLRLFPEGCFVLTDHGAVLGYAFVHPWLVNDIPKLNEFLLRVPSKPDCLLIHDVAVLQQARGMGASKALLELIAKLAKEREIPNLVLVSVYNSHLHWSRFGFEVAGNELTASKLNSYGETARYMVRRLR
jgi:N-acetylglutamate synthase-like GNAT family acetyltransferase